MDKRKFRNIFFINEYFPPDYAATGQLLKDLALRLCSKSYEVKVLTSYAYYSNSKSNAKHIENLGRLVIWRTRFTHNIKFIERIKILRSLLFSLRAGVKLIFDANKKDIIFLTSAPPFMPVIGYLVSFFSKSPYVIILFDLYPEILIDLKISKEDNFIIKICHFLQNKALKKSKNIIVLSNNMFSRISKKIPSIENKITIIPTWEDTNKLYKINKIENKFLKNFNLEDKFVVLYSGNQGRCHDLQTILDCAKHLKKLNEIVFIFVGNGFHNKKIRKFISVENLSNCLVLPYQEKKDLKYILSAADIGLVSVIDEATDIVAPSKLYGHLACKNAVGIISNEKSYLKNIVEANNCGKWFKNKDFINLANWILELKSDPLKLIDIGENARNFVIQNANHEVILKEYIRIIEKI